MQSRPAGFINIISWAAFPGKIVVPQHLICGYAVLFHEILNKLPQRCFACLFKLAAILLVADLNVQRTVIVSGSCIRDLIVRNNANDLAVQTDFRDTSFTPLLLSFSIVISRSFVLRESLDQESFDTSTPTGKLMLGLISSINQYEREILLERQREGIEIAKQKNVYKGRARKEFDEAVLNEILGKVKNKTMTVSEAARRLNVTRPTVYNILKRLE